MNDGRVDDEDKFEEIVSPPKLIDIRERAFSFAVRIVKLCKFLEKHSDVGRNVINQLLDAGTSVGANLEEAKAAPISFTKTVFRSKKQENRIIG